MTQLYIVHGWWAHLDAPGHRDDWDVWVTDSEIEAHRIIASLGPGAQDRVQVRPLAPSVYFDAQYAVNPRNDWESSVGPREEPRQEDEEAERLTDELTGFSAPPHRAPEDAPVWVRQQTT